MSCVVCIGFVYCTPTRVAVLQKKIRYCLHRILLLGIPVGCVPLLATYLHPHKETCILFIKDFLLFPPPKMGGLLAKVLRLTFSKSLSTACGAIFSNIRAYAFLIVLSDKYSRTVLGNHPKN